ncbi:MAG TPA: PAS domain S-box protein [Pseudomonadales bacterium]
MAAATVAAIAVSWLLHPLLGDGLVLMLLPAAVTVAVWRGGTRAGAAVAVIGYVAADLLFLGGGGRLGPIDGPGWMLLATYAVFCALVIGLGEVTWRSRAREHSSRGAELAERRRAAEDRGALAAIIEASDDAIISKDLQGTVRSWNPGAERLFGYSAEEVIGRSIRLIVPPELWQQELEILGRLARGERVRHFDTVRLTRTGRRLHISLSVSPIVDERGNVIGASKIARDITERKRAEAALRFSEERFRELADNIDQFAWTCDEHGNATWYNRRWYDYTGATVDEMRHGDWRRFHDPELVDGIMARFRKCVASGEPWEDTFPLLGRDGRWRWFLTRATPIRDENGRVVRWFGTNTDITEQRLLEQELVAADRRKDEFLATLAHELRNPLAPIRNALEVLNVAGDDAAKIVRAREIIDRQTRHMVRLVDDLLDVSRITRDRLELRRSTVDLNAVVEQALDVQRAQLEEKALDLNLDLPPHPVTLQGDPVRLAQIVSNLLSNAVRYTPSRGRIAVTVEEQGPDILLRVSDTGAGIPPDQLHAIFEMFTQIKDHHNVQGGLGVGLTLVKRLVELHGGTVEAFSAGPGEGSEFLVRLPAGTATEAPAARAQPRPVTAGSPRRVLVVEDNPDTAATLATLLDMAGHETRVAHDGAAAVEMAEAFRPDVVLLDLGLPKMDGIEVCRWLRRQPWGRKLTVAALTGWGQEADRRRTLEAGFDEHLVKPVGPEAVLALVASVSPPAAKALG